MVVEGYTDVMACHLAGVPTAVATCGTAFGTDHIKIARRLLSDDGSGGEVIFTFDGDAAGQKAALRAFEEDQRFVAQTFVAVEPSGADPCELRQSKGDSAVRDLIGSPPPAVRVRHPGHPANGTTWTPSRAGSRPCANPRPSWRRSATPASGPAYARELAGWLGMPVEEVSRAVGAATKRAAQAASAAPGGGQGSGHGQAGQGACRVRPRLAGPRPAWRPCRRRPFFRPSTGPIPRDPVAAMERQALEVALQEPGMLEGETWQRFSEARFSTPAYLAIHEAIRATGLGVCRGPGALGGAAAAGGPGAAAAARVRARRGAAAGQHARRRPALLQGHPGPPVRAADHPGQGGEDGPAAASGRLGRSRGVPAAEPRTHAAGDAAAVACARTPEAPAPISFPGPVFARLIPASFLLSSIGRAFDC